MSMFSKQHYEFLAEFISQLEAIETPEAIATKLADQLAAENPRFDSSRFIKAALKGE